MRDVADTEIIIVVEDDRIKVEISDFEEIQTQLHLSLQLYYVEVV